jgi:hypothetical protein
MAAATTMMRPEATRDTRGIGTPRGPRGDGLDVLRDSIRHGQSVFDATQVAWLLDRVENAERRVSLLTRLEAVDFRRIGSETYAVLRCRACLKESTGPTQATFLAAPLAACE